MTTKNLIIIFLTILLSIAPIVIKSDTNCAKAVSVFENIFKDIRTNGTSGQTLETMTDNIRSLQACSDHIIINFSRNNCGEFVQAVIEGENKAKSPLEIYAFKKELHQLKKPNVVKKLEVGCPELKSHIDWE